ncbi:MAG: Nif3-like dinuclear metal center hexameric protein [Coxiellaceae bacterium]|nr:Nif3-like dinuclear metal center hexameric protein [Coxiellaceae bacterium]|tara:strand:- start:7 stop:762 length:756 start_codon:yes stop_codon:yes gene_type:complete
MDIRECEGYLNQLLNAKSIRDYAPNGLQVSGTRPVQHIVTGVTACQALLDAAAKEGADTILVHHGYFFKGEPEVITGMKRNRIATLIQHDMHLLAYHLPLDCHPELGNNVLFGQAIGVDGVGTFSVGDYRDAGSFGSLKQPCSAIELSHQLEGLLGQRPLHIAGHSRTLQRIAWATGAAQDFIIEANALGVDAFITGEASERTCHYARENGIDFFAAGHHATERFGVKALGEHLANQFSLKQSFIDIPNPI